MSLIEVDYSTKIPNNVGLTEDRRILRALEGWHPGYLNWWRDMGPEGFQEAMVYLRTAVSVDAKGWAKFDYVRMPEYRWGILLAAQEEDRKIPFGRHLGESVSHDNGDQRAQHVAEQIRRQVAGQAPLALTHGRPDGFGDHHIRHGPSSKSV